MSAFGFCRQKPYNPAVKGNYPSAPIQQAAFCGQWGHLVNVMKREKEDKLGRAVAMAINGISGLTLYSHYTGYNGCNVPLYAKHTGFHPERRNFHFHTLLFLDH